MPLERQVLREKLSDLLGEKVRQIVEIMDKPDYTPKLQNQSQLDTIYESDFKDIQPYLFRVKNRFLYSLILAKYFNLLIFFLGLLFSRRCG